MTILSKLKSLILRALDRKPVDFMRPPLRDPATPSIEDIAASAEAELAGFVSNGHYVAQKPNDLGDACIWQGVYAAMCVHRWRVKQDETSRLEMVRAALALAKYVRRGVLHRGAMPASLENNLFHRDPTKTYHVDEDDFVRRDDASLDSLLGFCFGAATIQKYGDREAISIIGGATASLCGQFIEDDCRLVKRDGSPTRFGNCRPGLFQAPVRVMAACLPSLVCGCPVWRRIAEEYAPEFSTPDTQIPGKMSWVNANLATLAALTYVTATADRDPGRSEARHGLNRLLDKYSDAGNAFLIFGCLAARVPISGDERRIGELVLAEFPLDAKRRNSPFIAVHDQPAPVFLRPPQDIVWQRSPYEMGGGEEAIIYNRLDFLVSYYMSIW